MHSKGQKILQRCNSANNQLKSPLFSPQELHPCASCNALGWGFCRLNRNYTGYTHMGVKTLDFTRLQIALKRYMCKALDF